jgi:MoxR-like ATPase
MSSSSATHPGLCETLGVLGWNDLDPLLLGALATEAPVLLLGGHGTAKTLLVERVARALGEEFRHYNASLVNYDDLVGIPLPTDDGDLRFVGTRGAIWGAGFVFFDEVNRCRPDLQNKLFPVVHEKRLAGTDLEDLRYRWAAMNPPSGGDGGYLGTELLDVALADRFPVIARVPEWAQLARVDRERIASGECDAARPDAGAVVTALLGRTREELLVLEAVHREPVAAYTVVLADLLAQSGIHLSARRVRMLTRSVLATMAAGVALGRTDEPQHLAELAVRSGIPQLTEPTPPDLGKIIAAHVQAWDIAVSQRDPFKRRLLEEPDAVRRVRLGLDLEAPDDVLATLVIGALSSRPAESQKIALAVVLSRALATRDLTPAAWSAIAEKTKGVLTPRTTTTMEAPGPRLESWRSTVSILSREKQRNALAVLEEAFLTGCGPENLAAGPEPEKLLGEFRGHLATFEVHA